MRAPTNEINDVAVELADNIDRVAEGTDTFQEWIDARELSEAEIACLVIEVEDDPIGTVLAAFQIGFEVGYRRGLAHK